MTPERTRVFIVDDHPLVREWLSNLIQQQPDLTVCGEAASAAQAIQTIASARPDVAIVDLSLGDRPGLDLIKDLKQSHPALGMLVLSMHDEDLYAERALRAGARGYIMKREVTRKVILAIRQVREGKLYLSEGLAARLAEKHIGGRPGITGSPVEQLSDRELDVFRLMGQGHPTRRIAESLRVSVKTVQAYQARIKEKLQVGSLPELVREAVRWVEDERRS